MYLRQISLKSIDIHVLYVARKWVIQCVQWPLKLAYAFIYERLLESSIFRTQNILGPLTVCANRKESSPRSLIQAIQYVVMKF